MITRGTLTPHQREVYDRLVRISRRRPVIEGDPERYVWIEDKVIGSRGACVKLVEKGWVEVEHWYGPAGGLRQQFRPVSTTMSTPVDNKESTMSDQRMVRELQQIVNEYDTVGALRIVVGQLKAVFDRHDGIHPSPYTNHLTALVEALKEVHAS